MPGQLRRLWLTLLLGLSVFAVLTSVAFAAGLLT